MRTRLALTVFLLITACYQQLDLDEIDGGPRIVPGDVGPIRPDAPFDAGPPTVICGGTVCGVEQICCLLDARCIDRGDPSCAVLAEETDPAACASDDDCRPDLVCRIPRAIAEGEYLCAGRAGRCVVRGRPTGCDTDNPVCGCDGRTYPNSCIAAQLGATVAWPFACGSPMVQSYECDEAHDYCGPEHTHCDFETMRCVFEDAPIACGNDTQCPPSQTCCAITGLCHDPTRIGSCATPPEGTFLPCADAMDCARLDGSWWMGAPTLFCDGPGCGGPGGCNGASSCSGNVEPVCGCDGVTYQNACEAVRAHVRVLHDGACE